MSNDYPFEWNDVPKDVALKEKGHNDIEYIISKPGDMWMFKPCGKVAEKIYNFEVRPDDVWIVTYPKCGTTWTQEMLWNIVHGVDLEGSKAPSFIRCPFLEFESLKDDDNSPFQKGKVPDDVYQAVRHSLEFAASQPSPRVIKSHLALSMLPPKLLDTCKVIYTVRNPKDTCVSFFHHNQLIKEDLCKDFAQFKDWFMKGTTLYGSYWYHVQDAFSKKDHPNLKILHFEDMKKDQVKAIRETSEFIGYPLSEEKILTLRDHLKIDNMRKVAVDSQKDEQGKELFSKFFRKGESGDWKNFFEGEDLEKWDQWIADNMKKYSHVELRLN